jgi:tetratricopeptide (TPR) repeat protein
MLLFDPRDARRWSEQELSRPRQAHSGFNREGLAGEVGGQLARVGDVAAAREMFAQMGEHSMHHHLAVLWLADGEWETAVARLTDWCAWARRVGFRFTLAFSGFSLARAHRLLGHEREAEAVLREVLAVGIEGPHLPLELQARAERARLLAETSRADAAEPDLARMRAVLAAGEDWRGLAGMAALTEGTVAAARGREDDAAAQFEQAARIFRRYAVPHDEAEAYLAWAQLLMRNGDLQRARARLDEAATIYERIGAHQRWRDRLAVERARATGLSVP